MVMKDIKINNLTFQKIFKKYTPVLKAVARSYLNSSFDVDDAVSEVKMKIYKNIHTLRDHATFSAWITRIMRNYCFTVLKNKTIKRYVSVDYNTTHEFVSIYLMH